MTKTIKIPPAKSLKGSLSVPGDKSISHRAVMLGSIADGVTEIEGFLEGADNLATIEAFKKMGVFIERPAPGRLIIKGAGLHGLKEPNDVIDARNSGTTARLLMGLLSAQSFFSVITGDDSLRERPMKRVIEPLGLMGADIRGRNNDQNLPVAVRGARLKGITYSTPVASAQLKSSLLLAGLYADGETIIKEPEKTRDHTERMFRIFGADAVSNRDTVRIKKTKALKAADIIKIPGDISSAAFFIVGAIITKNSEVLIKGVGTNPTRCGIIEILKKMGADMEASNLRGDAEPIADMVARSSRLKGMDIDGREFLPAIDEFPILCVAAAFADGVTTIRGAGELRVKESDRIKVMVESLNKIGIKAEELKDGIRIQGLGTGRRAAGGSINSYGDHRIAMAMAMAGLCSENGVEIENADCVDVSYPGFFEDVEKARAG